MKSKQKEMGTHGAAVCLPRSRGFGGAGRGRGATSRSPSTPINRVPTINPNVYGQFAEHLGAGIYEGVWVGEKSAIPNTNGYRNDVVDALKNLQVPVVRWPGGCFADEYHWRDGIGDRAKAPREGEHALGRRGRDQRVRHARVHGLRRDDRHQGLHQRQRGFGQPAGNGRLDGVHDLRHRLDAGQRAPQERPRQAVGRALLRHRQRDLGLRRQHDAGVLRRTCSASTPRT